jgi:hypothetical protein
MNKEYPYTVEEMLLIFRQQGWRVAVHNDYQQDGKAWTFYLFTHSNGFWCKGEADNDLQALKNAWKQGYARMQAAPDLFYFHKQAKIAPMMDFSKLIEIEINCLENLFLNGPASYINPRVNINKTGYDNLIKYKLVEKWNGWYFLTIAGVKLVSTVDVAARNLIWHNKQFNIEKKVIEND